MHLNPLASDLPAKSASPFAPASRWARVLLLSAVGLLAVACNSSPEKPETASEPSTEPAAPEYRSPVVPYSAVTLRGAYAGYPAALQLIERLEAEQGFERDYLYGVFSRIEREQWILDYMNRPRGSGPPRPGSWTRYQKKFITARHLQRGMDFWNTYAADLQRAEAQFGVPAEYIVAIIGVETHYGSYVGSHAVINALATLAFDYPRRAEFFTDELESFLVMTRDEGLDPLAPVGSYAGAMGLGQFMPSSFLKYAVDFDGDGVRDLWNPVDAIGSVANYFKGHGWRTGEPVAIRAVARGRDPEFMEAGFSSRYSTATLATRGVTSTEKLDIADDVSLLRLNATDGYEYWIGLHNFYVISRYNHSTYYSMAVHQLAQALRAQAPKRPAGPIMSQVRANVAPTL